MDIPAAEKNMRRLKKSSQTFILSAAIRDELALREAARKGYKIMYRPSEFRFSPEALTTSRKQHLVMMSNSLKNGAQQDPAGSWLCSVWPFWNTFAIFPGGVNSWRHGKGNVLPDCFFCRREQMRETSHTAHTDFGKNFLYAIDVRTKSALQRCWTKAPRCCGNYTRGEIKNNGKWLRL